METGSAAGNPAYTGAVQEQVRRLARKAIYHTLELPDGTVLKGLISAEALRDRIRSFPVPETLVSKRLLDVGAASGWNAFEMERRGADVTAVDCVEFEEFQFARAQSGSRIDFRLLDVDELSAEKLGVFDYVLFLGVLYHLRHPLLALETICSMTREAAFVESYVTDDGEHPGSACTLEFYERDELGGQIDNWFGPTTKCLGALCRSAGFARVRVEYVRERRAGVTCYRRWEPEPERPGFPPPHLYSAVNNRTNDIWFHPGKDEYVCVYFRTEASPALDRMRLEIDGYGAPALSLSSMGNCEWQLNARVPPFLAPGEHLVRLRTVDSRFGNEFTISMRPPSALSAPELQAAVADVGVHHTRPASFLSRE